MRVGQPYPTMPPSVKAIAAGRARRPPRSPAAGGRERLTQRDEAHVAQVETALARRHGDPHRRACIGRDAHGSGVEKRGEHVSVGELVEARRRQRAP